MKVLGAGPPLSAGSEGVRFGDGETRNLQLADHNSQRWEAPSPSESFKLRVSSSPQSVVTLHPQDPGPAPFACLRGCAFSGLENNCATEQQRNVQVRGFAFVNWTLKVAQLLGFPDAVERRSHVPEGIRARPIHLLSAGGFGTGEQPKAGGRGGTRTRKDCSTGS